MIVNPETIQEAIHTLDVIETLERQIQSQFAAYEFYNIPPGLIKTAVNSEAATLPDQKHYIQPCPCLYVNPRMNKRGYSGT